MHWRRVVYPDVLHTTHLRCILYRKILFLGVFCRILDFVTGLFDLLPGFIYRLIDLLSGLFRRAFLRIRIALQPGYPSQKL